ncbi:hypothetical protein VB602_05570 [Vibrio parahaemolyticus]|uniref:hypothetical protein n=1 Tax=Vibrio TaxID=662 RepID=UPI00063DB8BF|nr:MULTISPECIES: hypothetical protein [Vibrio]KLI67636.1 hypothetical protein VVYB158_11985 [Vibrio vulnificus CladeA-yb158]HBC3533654.1 hypothetical protein [Vibrio vulnificus]EJL6790238.1 hypothetical protein [Vibrio alginolyticus]MBO0152173.1 hypothetical protein [Vibrio parahaemolyticus]MBT0085065.1 hypothetical protein [Vibrio alginolyticus]
MNSKSIALTFQGTERTVNQDFTTYCESDDGKEFWIIADGSTNAKDSGDFVTAFCSQLREQWLAAQSPVTEYEIQSLIKDVHSQIQRHFICSKGSFLLLIIEDNIQHCFYLGDCRVGSIEGNDIRWQTYPHSLTYRNVGNDEKKLSTDPDRHTLFNVLKGVRFSKPAYNALQLDLNKPLILASDGFWSCYPAQLPQLLTKEVLSEYLQTLEFTDDCTVLIRMANQ